MKEQKITCPRAWNKKRKEYFEIDVINYYKGECELYNGNIRIWCILKEVSFEWPTGRPDKNGKMIYQGDIVNVHKFLFDGSEIDENHIGVITYCSEIAAFKLDKIKGDFWEKYTGYKSFEYGAPICDLYGLHEESFEIIGNVNESPNLLEV